MLSSIRSSFAFLCGLLLISCAILLGGWFMNDRADRQISIAHESQYASYLLADELRQSSDDLTRLARTYVVTGDDRYEKQYNTVLDIRNGKAPRPTDYHRIYWDFIAANDNPPRANGTTAALQDLMKQIGFTEDELAKLKEAQANSDGLVNLEVEAMNAVKGISKDSTGKYTVKGEPDLAKARELMHSRQYHQFKAQIMKPVDEFYQKLEKRSAAQIFSAEEKSNFYNNIMLCTIAFLVITTFVTVWALFRRTLAPLNALRLSMASLAEGQIAIDIPGVGRNDEIGAMAKAVAVFKHNLQENRKLQEEAEESRRLQAEHEQDLRQKEQEHQRQAKEHLEKRLREAEAQFEAAEAARRNRDLEEQTTKERAAAEAAAKRTTETFALAQSFEQAVGHVVDQVAVAASDMRKLAEQMVKAVDDTTKRTANVASSSEQADTNVRTVAAAAEELAASISEISRQVQSSTKIAGEAVDQSEKTNREVESLADAAKRIGEIVNLIQDIASKTNLLALNATIEAARAGEAGKGFAVVASEVKTLANQTAKATDEISGQIGTIQTRVDGAVQAIRKIGATIGHVNEIATSIASAVEQQGSATQEIARNVQQASSGTRNVTQTISGVTEVAQRTGSAASSVLSAADQLSAQAAMLRQEVSSFIEHLKAA